MIHNDYKKDYTLVFLEELLLVKSIFIVVKRDPLLLKYSTGLLTLKLVGANGLTTGLAGIPVLPEVTASVEAAYVVK